MQGVERADRKLLDAAALVGHLIPEGSMFWFSAPQSRPSIPRPGVRGPVLLGAGSPVGAGSCGGRCARCGRARRSAAAAASWPRVAGKHPYAWDGSLPQAGLSMVIQSIWMSSVPVVPAGHPELRHSCCSTTCFLVSGSVLDEPR